MYWFPEHALLGEQQPVLFMYSLLRWYTVMKTWLDGPLGLGVVVYSAGGAEGVRSLGLGDLTFWRCWERCPKILLLALGQYLAM
jgi:hypothetical protein